MLADGAGQAVRRWMRVAYGRYVLRRVGIGLIGGTGTAGLTVAEDAGGHAANVVLRYAIRRMMAAVIQVNK